MRLQSRTAIGFVRIVVNARAAGRAGDRERLQASVVLQQPDCWYRDVEGKRDFCRVSLSRFINKMALRDTSVAKRYCGDNA